MTYDDKNILFEEAQEEVGCLCTFPHNWEPTPSSIDGDTLRSLALLGAAVVLAHHGELADEWVYIPSSIPQWIRDGIDLHIRPEQAPQHGWLKEALEEAHEQAWNIQHPEPTVTLSGQQVPVTAVQAEIARMDAVLHKTGVFPVSPDPNTTQGPEQGSARLLGPSPS